MQSTHYANKCHGFRSYDSAREKVAIQGSYRLLIPESRTEKRRRSVAEFRLFSLCRNSGLALVTAARCYLMRRRLENSAGGDSFLLEFAAWVRTRSFRRQFSELLTSPRPFGKDVRER